MIQHQDIHLRASAWSESQTLHVAAVYSNAFRWDTRRILANNFKRHMLASSNVALHFVELAYGDRPFEATGDHEGDIQLRTASELFHKENLGNIAVKHFPADWQYGAILDADFVLTRHDWALEAVHQLQMYDFVQLYSSYTNVSGKNLSNGHRPLGSSNSFAYNWFHNGHSLPHNSLGYGHKNVGATGGAWAFRRRAFDAVGTLLDRCVLGSADWIMAFGLAGEKVLPQNLERYSPDYRAYIEAWADRATSLTKNFGYVDQHAIHHFHGPKSKRGYSTRDEILIKHQYSPITDVYPDWQGVLQLSPKKPALRDDIRRYFISRSEDMPHV